MNVERVRITTALKCGDRKYKKDAILSGAQITPDIIAEVRAGTGLVEVLPPVLAPAPADPHVIRVEMAKRETEEFVKETEEAEKTEDKVPVVPEIEELSCSYPGCDFVAKSAFGLQSHQRAHRSN